MTNVVHIRGAHGAMPARHHIRSGKLSEADFDAQVAANRERVAEVFEAAERAQAPKARTSVILLDNSLLAKLMRWVRNLRLKGPRL